MATHRGHKVATGARVLTSLFLLAGWVLIMLNPEIIDRTADEVAGPGAAAWRTMAVLSVVVWAFSEIRPSVASVSASGAIPVAIGMYRGGIYLDLGSTSPLGVWLLLTALMIYVVVLRLEKVE